MNDLAKELKENNKLGINIEGYTDSKGSSSYNIKLSNKRCMEVEKYLIKQGVDKTKIKYYGFGETKPAESNKTESGRKYNRRVTIKSIVYEK